MNCVIHKNKESSAKCVVCGKPLCAECAEFQEKYGACPKCLKRQAEVMYQTAKRGIVYNILSLICAVAFLTIYVVELCLGNLNQTYIIGGSIIIGVLVPVSITMFVLTLLKMRKYKNFLKNDKN